MESRRSRVCECYCGYYLHYTVFLVLMNYFFSGYSILKREDGEEVFTREELGLDEVEARELDDLFERYMGDIEQRSPGFLHFMKNGMYVFFPLSLSLIPLPPFLRHLYLIIHPIQRPKLTCSSHFTGRTSNTLRTPKIPPPPLPLLTPPQAHPRSRPATSPTTSTSPRATSMTSSRSASLTSSLTSRRASSKMKRRCSYASSMTRSKRCLLGTSSLTSSIRRLSVWIPSGRPSRWKLLIPYFLFTIAVN